jgi:serine/threonine-protein kinase RsbW
VTGEKTLFSFPSRIEAVNEAAASVARILNTLGASDDLKFAVDMAVREAVTNAVLHGNKLDESKSVELQVTTSSDTLEIVIDDEGSGFRPEDVPDPTAAENILKTSGRGIFFMRNFMDKVDWSVRPEGGTSVRLTKEF